MLRRVMTRAPRFVEIAVNLGDPMFRGIYHEKQKHEDDLKFVLNRAERAGVAAQIVTAGSLRETIDVLPLVRENANLYSTAGCHPTRTKELESYQGGPCAYVDALAAAIQTDTRIVAVGECGLGML